MSSHAIEASGPEVQKEVTSSVWGGGKSPFAIPNVKLAMWLFLASDTLIFSGFLAAYWALRLWNPNWPSAAEAFHGLGLVSTMTFILICSSATMATAVSAAKDGNRARTIRWLTFTIIGGLFFLGAQAFEWTEFIREGATLMGNPWGVPKFSAFFFVVTGFHGTHVLSGVMYLLVETLRARGGHYSGTGIEIAGLYWHFVDLVWVFIFTLFYLL